MIDRAKVEKMRDDIGKQKEQAIASAHALHGALDVLNAVLAFDNEAKAESAVPPQ